MQSGLAKIIIEEHRKGKPVYGICGGFQMMGREIRDPHHVEGDTEYVPGLGILPVSTSLTTEKQTIQCNFSFLGGEEVCEGYEIHMGETTTDIESPLCTTGDMKEGYILNSRTWGTYIHGIFDNRPVVESVLRQVDPEYQVQLNFRDFKESNYNKLADLVRDSVDMEYIYRTMGDHS
jgi:adenosylcobyric acid synthase